MAISIANHLAGLEANLWDAVRNLQIDPHAAQRIYEEEKYKAQRSGTKYEPYCRDDYLDASVYAIASQRAMTNNDSPVDPNTLPAMAMELEALVDLFVARFGTAWVKVDTDITNDNFWRIGHTRLREVRKLETFNAWIRIIPNNVKDFDGNN